MAPKPRVTKEQIIDGVDKYLKTANPPIIAEYAHSLGITRQRLYQIADKDEAILDAIKRIVEAKEVMLEKKGLTGEYSATMAIFSLKQLGWRDRVEEEDREALDKLDGILAKVKDAAISETK